jgi:hypothetical protein
MIGEFYERLRAPEVRNILLCGCGGGFDFVHSGLFIPLLKELGKNIVIASNSFGDPASYVCSASQYVKYARGREDFPPVVQIDEQARQFSEYYAPEYHMKHFLDQTCPEEAPHIVYAYYARDFHVDAYRRLMGYFVRKHEIDCVLMVDGGSDSLMKGDEAGLGDPLEDCVSITALATLKIPRLRHRMLAVCGLGTDRHNDVSDASSLRAIAELTQAGAALGAAYACRPGKAHEFYSRLLEYISSRQEFQSVVAHCLQAAGAGSFGFTTPDSLRGRAGKGELFLWPTMATIYLFDVIGVYQRSMIAQWIKDAKSTIEMERKFSQARKTLREQGRILPDENFPLHEQMSIAAHARKKGNPDFRR